jgi:exonuclease SbcD
MRILHTSDWHLGRLFHRVHLTEDQAYVLEQVIACARDARPDVVVVAGDIYDRSVPPTEAVSLLNEILSRLVLEVGVEVIMIAGNHDNPDRLAFGSSIMSSRGLHIVGRLTVDTQPIVLGDRHGPVHFYTIPYAEPAEVKQLMEADGIEDHDCAMAALVGRIREARPRGVRSVITTHAFVAGGRESESERPLSIGGAGTVDAARFRDFDFVILGHLHRPQQVGLETIHYSGSLLKYSFSETDQQKCLKLIDMDSRGRCSVEVVPLKAKHDVRAVSGYLDDLINHPDTLPAREDYLSVTLLDRGAVYDPMGKLRAVYPNVLEIKRDSLYVPGQGKEQRIDHRKTSEVELFADFYNEVTGERLSAEQRKVFASVVDHLRQQDREADA